MIYFVAREACILNEFIPCIEEHLIFNHTEFLVVFFETANDFNEIFPFNDEKLTEFHTADTFLSCETSEETKRTEVLSLLQDKAALRRYTAL
jgi:hypothetical protein